MKPTDYFATHPVFRFQDFAAAHGGNGKVGPQASQTALKQHVKAGNLLHIRRGIYAVVPRGQTPDSMQVDPYVLAGQLAPDSVIAYHSALQFHGKAYSVFQRLTYLTCHKAATLEFRGTEYVAVPVPSSLRELPQIGGGILERQRGGTTFLVTTLERTLVDVLGAPKFGGGWEEIWRSLESVEYFRLDDVIEYSVKLNSAVTIARVGFYLEQHRETLMVEENHLRELEKHAPKKPMYLDRSRRAGGRFFKRWNLIVPDKVVERTWEEFNWY